MQTVTQNYTGVSYTTGSGMDGGAVLNVSRRYWVEDEALARRHLYLGPRPLDGRHGFIVPMSDDGRWFASRDAAHAFALERGYLQEYFTIPELRARRIEAASALPYPVAS